MSRVINFFDGATSPTAPVIGDLVTSELVTYPDDATYEATETNAPAVGNIYYNTTLDLVRYYNGTAWVTIVDESSTQTVTNKSIDGTTNTITNVDGDNVIVDAIASLTATDAQAAFAEHQGDITTLETDKENKSEKGAVNGYAGLDGTAKVPVAQLPDAVLGGPSFQGTWNASTNTPTLVDGVGTQGDYYRVSVAGTTTIDGITDWGAGDWIIFNGTAWDKIDNSESVASVAGKTGVVTLVAADVTDFDTEVSNNTSVAANTAKVSADGSIDTHSDVDTTTAAPTDGQVLTWNNGNSEWEPQDSTGGGSANSLTLDNVGIDTSIAANILTVRLKQLDGSTDPAAAPNAVNVPFRSATLTDGATNIRSITSALSLATVVGADLGHTASEDNYIFVYLIDDAGVISLGISSQYHDDGIVHTTVLLDGTSSSVDIYSAAVHTTVPIRLIGRLKSNQVTPGTFATAMAEVSVNSAELSLPFLQQRVATFTSAAYPHAVSTWGNITSLSLPAGTYDITGYITANVSSSETNGVITMATSENTGATTTDHVFGVNEVHQFQHGTVGFGQMSMMITNYRIVLPFQRTFFLKTFKTGGVTQTTIAGRLVANRVRTID